MRKPEGSGAFRFASVYWGGTDDAVERSWEHAVSDLISSTRQRARQEPRRNSPMGTNEDADDPMDHTKVWIGRR